jgi:hypothetical protein
MLRVEVLRTAIFINLKKRQTGNPRPSFASSIGGRSDDSQQGIRAGSRLSYFIGGVMIESSQPARPYYLQIAVWDSPRPRTGRWSLKSMERCIEEVEKNYKIHGNELRSYRIQYRTKPGKFQDIPVSIISIRRDH